MPTQQLIQQLVQIMIQQYKVDIRYKKGVLDEDLEGYVKGDIKLIFKAIVKRFKTNANPHHVNPDWLLKNDLFGSIKIRLLDEGIRVIYRVAEELPTHTVIDIYAVGPRKDELAYMCLKNVRTGSLLAKY
ncbi:hypothetical protein D3C73_568760 [compost metagenome]|uniref:mRNA interferase RelE/StbE n=1 Tax=Paenibacillus jilunlii TaxID=682956 RepID=A0A1G9QMJ0_9BACL|nr:hypothetical protein [Paenibacillus jilunlii]KWX74552.1 hypothetical protein AML91_15230 [Paenibacillus jilunlii]SDM12234.1 hypothetical protein SAMN05216191_10937 [Paenibacillus jilunlii]